MDYLLELLRLKPASTTTSNATHAPSPSNALIPAGNDGKKLIKEFLLTFALAIGTSFLIDFIVRRKDSLIPRFFRHKDKGTIKLDQYESRIAKFLVRPDEIEVKFADIGGMEAIKREAFDNLCRFFNNPDLFSESGLAQPPKGLLLYGPPGTGKTMIAKAIAKQTNAYFINVKTEEITGYWLGESEKITSAIFSLARKLQPCIIFLDEIDAVLGRQRGRHMHEVYQKQISILLSNWDGMASRNSDRIVVIGTTNNLDALDEAVLRRMPIRIEVQLPNVNEREEILRIILKNEKLEPDFDFKQVARLTEYYSGSDLKELGKRAAMLQMREWTETILQKQAETDLENLKKTHGLFDGLEEGSPEYKRKYEAYRAKLVNERRYMPIDSRGYSRADLRPLTVNDFIEATKHVKPSITARAEHAATQQARLTKLFHDLQ